VSIHECCYEYADNCVSCSLHSDIRKDERSLIAGILSSQDFWSNQEIKAQVIDLVLKGSSNPKTTYLKPYKIEYDKFANAAYILVEAKSIRPPIRTVSDLTCNVDIDADGRVAGLEVFEWPITTEGLQDK
jgi:uncharacterized protein YuzE